MFKKDLLAFEAINISANNTALAYMLIGDAMTSKRSSRKTPVS